MISLLGGSFTMLKASYSFNYSLRAPQVTQKLFHRGLIDEYQKSLPGDMKETMDLILQATSTLSRTTYFRSKILRPSPLSGTVLNQQLFKIIRQNSVKQCISYHEGRCEEEHYGA